MGSRIFSYEVSNEATTFGVLDLPETSAVDPIFFPQYVGKKGTNWSLRRYLRNQYRDRMRYWAIRQDSRLHTPCIAVILDGMDQAKFAYPRFREPDHVGQVLGKSDVLRVGDFCNIIFFSKSMAVIPLLVTADWVTRVPSPKHPEAIEKYMGLSHFSSRETHKS